jgi:hypothetical protein
LIKYCNSKHLNFWGSQEKIQTYLFLKAVIQ